MLLFFFKFFFFRFSNIINYILHFFILGFFFSVLRQIIVFYPEHTQLFNRNNLTCGFSISNTNFILFYSFLKTDVLLLINDFIFLSENFFSNNSVNLSSFNSIFEKKMFFTGNFYLNEVYNYNLQTTIQTSNHSIWYFIFTILLSLILSIYTLLFVIVRI